MGITYIFGKDEYEKIQIINVRNNHSGLLKLDKLLLKLDTIKAVYMNNDTACLDIILINGKTISFDLDHFNLIEYLKKDIENIIKEKGLIQEGEKLKEEDKIYKYADGLYYLIINSFEKILTLRK